MPLNEETKEKIRNVFLRKFDDLPVAKDLPRLAKFITICDEDGKSLPYKEYQKLDSEKYFENGVLQVEIKLFLHIRRVLLVLMTALEGEEQAINLDKALIPHIGDENFFLPEVLTKFMMTHVGDESKVIKALKCCNQVNFYYFLFGTQKLLLSKKKQSLNNLITTIYFKLNFMLGYQ